MNGRVISGHEFFLGATFVVQSISVTGRCVKLTQGSATMGATLSRECVPVAEAQQEVLDNFSAQKRMEQMKEMMEKDEGVVVVTGSGASDIKPPGSQRGEAGLDLAPLCARDLQEGVVHKGRGLAGVILETGICTGGSCFLLEDVLGRHACQK